MTEEEYQKILQAQNGGCAICNKPPTANKSLAVDHCHSTGKIRGILCSACNSAIGALGDTPESIIKVLKYLEVSNGNN